MIESQKSKTSRRKFLSPPRLSRMILNVFRLTRGGYSLLGDMDEEYRQRAETRGRRSAAWWYRGEVIRSIPELTINFLFWSGLMFKNYLKIIIRILRRSRAFSLINIAGLAVGLACSLIITLYLHHELNFDRFHKNSDRIYRVCAHIIQGSEPFRGAWTSPPLADALKEDFPEVEEVVRFSPWSSTYLIQTADKQYLERGVRFADGSFFDIFSFPLIAGDPQTALKEPLSVVLTRTASARYFGRENPLGKTLNFKDLDKDFKVTGLMEDCPAQSHLQFDILVSLSSSRNAASKRWMQHNYFTYARLSSTADPRALEAKLPDFFIRHFGPQFTAETGKDLKEYMDAEGYYSSYVLEPLKKIHLNAGITDNLSLKGSPSDLFIFGTIAFFTLIIACINFMNLSTARFAHRSKEVGIRKVLGSSRKQLIAQFLTESVGMSLFAFLLSLLAVYLFLPSFGRLVERKLSLAAVLEPAFALPMILILLAVGLFAGSYPSLFLSSFAPTDTIKGPASVRGRKHLFFRRGLVVLQFGITFFVCLGTLVVYSQLRFFRNRDLGFDKDNILVIHRADALGAQGRAFKQALLARPGILAVSNSETMPGRHFDPTTHHLEGRDPTEEHRLMTMYGDEDFLKVYGLELADGRYFDPRIDSDSTSAVVINESAAKAMGLTEPLGKRITKDWGGAKPGGFATIIGVLKDFHFASLHQTILPMIIRPMMDRWWNYTSVKLRTNDIPATLTFIEGEWKRNTGGQPFTYSFVDSDFDLLYKTESRASRLFGVFAGLGILVACLGLFGLLSFTAEQRTKEIGIRKILGASVAQVTALITKEVLVLVLLASLISAPLAYFVMHKWLQNFAYRISITGLMFAATALFLVLAALAAVAYRAVKSASANPSQSLRYE
jgi:putative ABC transport system permease protein